MHLLENLRPLDPADFSFYGFDDMMGPQSALVRRIRKLHIRSGEPTVTKIDGGVFIPATRSSTGPFVNEGGILDSEGKPIEDVQVRRPHDVILLGLSDPDAVVPVRQLDEEVVYFGWLFDHFGHLILESLARTWYLKEVDPSVRVVFHRTGPPIREGIIRQVLKAFGIPQNRLLFLDEPTRLRRIVIPEPLYELSRTAHQRAAEPHQAVAKQILGQNRSGALTQPIYLSRRSLPSSRRAIVGEAELEEVLRGNGFAIAYPETMTFKEQVRLFNTHTDIFSCAGSAAHNVLFALSRPRLHLLAESMPAPDYFLSSRLVEAPATFVRCLTWGGRRAGGSRYAPYLVEMPTVLEYLEERGFLRKPPGPTLRDRISALGATHDEQWLCARLRVARRPGNALQEEEEKEALRLAVSSWPLTWLLAQHYARHAPTQVADLAERFIALVADERDPDRLARYRGEVAGAVGAVVGAIAATRGPKAAAQLSKALAKHFAVDATIQPLASTHGESNLALIGGKEGASVMIVGLNRTQLLSAFPKGGCVAEIGVSQGHFSEHIKRFAEPRVLHLIDPWASEGDRNPQYTTSVMDEAYEHIKTTFRDDIAANRIVLHRDYSTNIAQTFPDHFFDWIYLDAVHSHDNVHADLHAFKDKVKPDGFIFGHDFSNYRNSRLFGVIPAVREFVRSEGFELVLLTNETDPSYLLARTESPAIPALKGTLLNTRRCSIVELDDSLLDTLQQVPVTYANGRKGRIMRFG